MSRKINENFNVKDLSGDYFATMEYVTGKRAEAIVDTRRDENARYLWTIYGRYSNAKRNALEYCKKLCFLLHGDAFRITSHNAQFFSVKFSFVNPCTGVLSVAHITAKHNYFTDATTEYCEKNPYAWGWKDFTPGYTEE